MEVFDGLNKSLYATLFEQGFLVGEFFFGSVSGAVAFFSPSSPQVSVEAKEALFVLVG